MKKKKVYSGTVPSIKTIYMDVHLDFEERLLKKVGESINKTKQRIHETELTLNLKPPDDEVEEVQLWKARCEELLNRREVTEFPTFQRVKKEWDKKALINSIKESRNRVQFKMKMNEMLTKQAEQIRKKVLSKGGRFGSSEMGLPLKTIGNYSGWCIFEKGPRQAHPITPH